MAIFIRGNGMRIVGKDTERLSMLMATGTQDNGDRTNHTAKDPTTTA